MSNKTKLTKFELLSNMHKYISLFPFILLKLFLGVNCIYASILKVHAVLTTQAIVTLGLSKFA